MNRTAILMSVGYTLLGLGVALFVAMALKGEGNSLLSFLCLMGSLLFFNLPAVLARKKAEREKTGPD